MAKLEGKWHLQAVTHPNPDETNCAMLLTIQLGALDRQRAATAILLGDIVAQPYFAELRTKQQVPLPLPLPLPPTPTPTPSTPQARLLAHLAQRMEQAHVGRYSEI